MTTTITTSNEEYIDALESIRQAYAQVLETWNTKILPAGDPVLQVIAGMRRFNSEMLLNGEVGYHNPNKGTCLVYGDWYPIGNMEGSLYYLHGFGQAQGKFAHSLRVRWDGSSSISYDGTEMTFGRDDKLGIVFLGGRRISTETDGSLHFVKYEDDDYSYTPVTDLEQLLDAMEALRESLTAVNAELEEVVASAEPVKQ
ncbi:hypothetical protein I8H83_04185 [Candidatus Saccharibacteria bacterium]|nr:hypothetical protein [Candidatus Saccharibacteria bacterium]MBH2007777.1 hypothetical protein [Candidatus Saccharibacteria bacterium]